MKLSQLILEAKAKPKAVIMAGGAGAGKSYLLNQLDLGGLTIFNPDKYVEDKEHTYYGNLSAAANQVNQDVEYASKNKENFIWDTTASNSKKVQDLVSNGYEVFMVMVYTHPLISFISNFERERQIPKTAVFSTWRDVYQQIGYYKGLLGDRFMLFANDRGGKYDKEIKEFNVAARNGSNGISDYLAKYMEDNGGAEGFISTFRKPYDIDDKIAADAYRKEVADIDYNREDESMDKQLKKYWMGFYEKNGTGPGDDKMKKKVSSITSVRQKAEEKNKEVLNNIADMIHNAKFVEQLKGSTVAEIDQRVQNFLT